MNNEIIQKLFQVKSSTIDDMKDLLHQIKSYKDEKLAQRVKELEDELKEIQKAKKYWLVWEEKQEIFDKETIWKLPVLEEIKERNIQQDISQNNILIEWDNYHTLSVLNYTHAWKIDVIYIDPFYNTWKDFIYNDKYVDKEDKFRHSKWLSFMNKRLRLAINLLSEKWIIFISIDDNELFQLKILCDEIFWSENFISNLVWNNSTWWWLRSKFFNKNNEYILCYAKNIENLEMFFAPTSSDWIKQYKKLDENGLYREQWFAWQNKSKGDNQKYPIKTPDWTYIIPKEWYIYRFIESSFEKLKLDNLIVFKKTNQSVFQTIDWEYTNWTISVKDYLWDWLSAPTTLLPKEYVKLNIEAINQIKDIFWEKIFDYPKPTTLIRYLIQILWDNYLNSTILDFFAWSWTTGHAVLELNKEDNWNRKFILATNNENNICEEVTYERIKRVMTWYTNQKWEQVQWLWWNLTYLRNVFIDKSNVNDDLRTRMVARCSELLCLKENIWQPLEIQTNEHIKIFQRHDKYLAILYDMFYFEEFKEVLKTLEKPISIYAFSHYKLTKSDFEEIKNIEIEQIPDPILEVYESIFWL